MNPSRHTWSYLITDDIVILLQEKEKENGEKSFYRMVVPLSDADKELNLSNIDDRCNGCHHLPLKGYSSDKSDWCDTSRGVANLYLRGHRWTILT